MRASDIKIGKKYRVKSVDYFDRDRGIEAGDIVTISASIEGYPGKFRVEGKPTSVLGYYQLEEIDDKPVTSSSDIPQYLVVEHAPDNLKIRGRYHDGDAAETATYGLANGSPGTRFSLYRLDYSCRVTPHEWKVGDIGRLKRRPYFTDNPKFDAGSLVEVEVVDDGSLIVKAGGTAYAITKDAITFVARPE